MEYRRAAFLQEMGITRWEIRKPALFKTDNDFKQINFSACKLLVVCNDEELQHPLMAAVLHAFSIDHDSVKFCTRAQFEMQEGPLPALVWSTTGEIEDKSIQQLFVSPSLLQLAEQPNAKKSLWKQFCAYQQ